MDNINDTALFDNYLHKELSAEEIKDFEARLKADSKFHEDFEIHKTIIHSIVSMGNSSLKSELNTIHQDREKQLKKRIGFYFFLGALVVAAFLLVRLEHQQPTAHTLDYTPSQVITIKDSTTDSRAKTTNIDTVKLHQTNIKPTQAIKKPVVNTSKTPSFALTAAGTKMIYLASLAKQPEYMYFDNTVHLTGWKNLSPHHIDLRIKKNKLYLYHNKTYYELAETNKWTITKPVKDTRNFGTLQHATSKSIKITVLIHPMKIERSAKQLQLFTTDSLPHSKWYRLNNDQLIVSLKGLKGLNKGRVVLYKKGLYLKTASKTFKIETKNTVQKFKSTTIEDWKNKHIIEVHIKPKYLNFEDLHHLEQSN